MNEPHVTDDLSLYAAGALDGAERRAVERHLDRCAECRAALRREEEAVWSLAAAAAREPPRDLRERIVARHRHAPAPLWWFAFAAALILALAAGGGLAATRLELARERAVREEYARALAAVTAGSRILPLEGRGAGAVIVPREGDPYLVLALPAPPPGKAYEAWIIRGGTAVPAGLAPAREGVVTVRLTVAARPGDVAAVTLEAAEGAAQPTSEPLLVGRL